MGGLARLCKALLAQAAGIAHATGAPLRVGLITRNGERVIDPELQALADDVGFAELDQRRVQG